MIDIEQRALGAFEQNRLAVAHRIGEQKRYVADPRLHALGVLQHLIEHRLPVHRAVLHQPVARRDVVAHVLFEARRIGEVAHADPAACNLVFVRGTDAARRRADLPFASSRFGEQVEIAVVRQNQVRLVADDDAVVDVDAVSRQLVHFGEQGLRIDHDTISDDARDTRMQNAGGNQTENELRPVHVHGMAGVVSALVPCHEREMRREEIDDLAFAFIAPLRTEDGNIHSRQSAVVLRQSESAVVSLSRSV